METSSINSNIYESVTTKEKDVTMMGMRSEIHMDESGYDQMNSLVNNYSVVEFVAIPPQFDIMKYLSMREGSGIFDAKNVDLKQLKIMAQSIAIAPVFNIRNNNRISPVTCMYLLKILNELGVVLKSVPNPIRKDIDHLIKMVDSRDSTENAVWVRGQRAKRVNFTIVNIFPLMSDDAIQEAIQIGQKLERYEEEIDQKIKELSL